jgi:hypothetical protein
MGLTVLFAVMLGVVGFGALFVAPWLGGTLLVTAVIVGLIGVFWIGTHTEEFAREDEPEAPHMPGPPS